MEDELERNTVQGVPTFSLLGKATQERSTAQSLPSLIALALWVPFSVDNKLGEKNPFIHLQKKKVTILTSKLDDEGWFWTIGLMPLQWWSCESRMMSHSLYNWMLLFKLLVVSLIKLEWTLSSTGWYRFANGLCGTRQPIFLFAALALCILRKAKSLKQNHSCLNPCRLKDEKIISATLRHYHGLAPMKHW